MSSLCGSLELRDKRISFEEVPLQKLQSLIRGYLSRRTTSLLLESIKTYNQKAIQFCIRREIGFSVSGLLDVLLSYQQTKLLLIYLKKHPHCLLQDYDKGRSFLHRIVENCWEGLVETPLFEIKELINKPDMYGETPVFSAVRSNDLTSLERLIGSEADLNLRNNQGQNLLHVAAESNALFCLPKLVKSGVGYRITDNLGLFPIHRAIQGGGMGCFNYLFNLMDQDVGLLDEYQLTLMHHASREGKRDIVLFLLQEGAPYNTFSIDGRFPIHDAAFFRHHDIVEVLRPLEGMVNPFDQEEKSLEEYLKESQNTKS